MKTLDRLLILLLIISIAISVYFFTVKITVEQQNNNVEISVPLKEIDMLSKITGMKSEAIIDKLKTSGMTSIAVEEYTLRDITELGRAIILNGWQLADNLRFIGTDSPLIKDLISEQNLDMNSYYVLTREPDIFKKTMNAMIARGYQIRTFEDQTEGLYIIQEVKGDGFFSSIGLGFDRSQFDLVKVSGLNTIAYAKQLQDKSPDEIADLTSSILDVDASVLIFQDNQVPKDPESRQLLINFFKANDSTLGFDEFISTNNISQFIKDIDYNAARVYNRPQHKWMDEYLIATRDRNDRILYLHLFLSGQDDMLTYNAKHIAEIKDEIISRGITNRFNFGNAKPFKAFSFNKLFSFAASFGILWGIWRLLSLCKSARQFKIKTIVLIFIIFIGLAIFDFSIFRNIAGLTAAVCFPVLGICSEVMRDGYNKCTSFTQLVKHSICGLIRATAITFIGAMILWGIFGDISSLLGLEKFRGIKALYVLSYIVIVAIYMNSKIKDFTLNKPIFSVKGILGIAVICLALFVLLNRTGNQSVIPIPKWELFARIWLERVFLVRPRTKEFLIGFPALIIAGGLKNLNHSRQADELYLVALLGEISMINTFSHFHNSALVSLVRSFEGILLGCILGIAALGGFYLYEKRGKCDV